jgi:Ner family transcriptional regulator
MSKSTEDGWHPEDIKAEVRKTGISLAELSRSNGLPEHACRHALQSPYFEAEMLIAETLGRSPRELWPERYTATGETRHPPRLHRLKDSPANPVPHRQNQEAA